MGKRGLVHVQPGQVQRPAGRTPKMNESAVPILKSGYSQKCVSGSRSLSLSIQHPMAAFRVKSDVPAPTPMTCTANENAPGGAPEAVGK